MVAYWTTRRAGSCWLVYLLHNTAELRYYAASSPSRCRRSAMSRKLSAVVLCALICIIPCLTNIEGAGRAEPLFIEKTEGTVCTYIGCFVNKTAVKRDNVLLVNDRVWEADGFLGHFLVSIINVVPKSIRYVGENCASNLVGTSPNARILCGYYLSASRAIFPLIWGEKINTHYRLEELGWRVTCINVSNYRGDALTNLNSPFQGSMKRSNPSTLSSNKCVMCCIGNLFARCGLGRSGSNHLVRLFRARTHLIQLALGHEIIKKSNDNPRNSSNSSRQGCNSTNPFWRIQFWKYIASVFFGILSVAAGFISYFWLLFTVAVPRGVPFFYGWFGGFRVAQWDSRKRRKVAVLFGIFSMTSIIIATLCAIAI